MERQHCNHPRRIGLLLITFISATLSGCASLGYLAQAGKGQLALFNRARPIEAAVKDERVPPQHRMLLAELPLIKAFGERLGLKATRNYEEYVQLDRPFVVMVVSACEPLRFQAKTWSFPVVGSFNYLGWFDEAGAKDLAQSLKAEGLDVDMRGASAYSSLGWFRDPVLSSMLEKGGGSRGSLINVVLHESVHATVYIKNQSSFNESLASFIADKMTVEYFQSLGPEHAQDLSKWQEIQNKTDESKRKLHAVYEQLFAVYSNAELSDGDKRQKKSEILSKVNTSGREINNATLIQYRTYFTGSEDFERLYSSCNKDWVRFIRAVSQLKEVDFARTQDEAFGGALDQLIERGACAPTA